MLNRFFRIFPAYWAHLVIVASTLYFLNLSLVNSISSNHEIPRVKFFTYVLNNFSLWQSGKDIPGLFPNNSYPHLINAILWSLFPEFICYILLILSIKICVHFEVYPHIVLFVIIGVSIALGFAILFVEEFLMYSDVFFEGKTIEALRVVNALQSFAVGSLLAVYPKILINLRMKSISLIFLVGMFMLVTSFSAYFLLGSICFSIFIVLLGSGRQKLKFLGWCDKFDVSFGVYLYHAPILQVFISLNIFNVISISSIQMLLLLSSVTCSMAMFSWILIEKPSKGLSEKIKSYLSRL